MSLKFECWSCKKEVSLSSEKIGFREECPHCGTDIHSCKNCLHHDPKAYNECKETSADVVREKDRNNYCDYYVLAKDRKGQVDQAAKLRAAAEALFKKS